MKDMEQSAPPKRADYVYIAALGHSGSTLLELLLGGHPRMTAVGEIYRFNIQFSRANRPDRTGLCSCGKRPMDCPVWSKVAEAVKREYGVSLEDDPFGWRISNVGPERDKKIRTPFHMLARAWYKACRFAKYYDLPVLKWFSGASLTHRRWIQHRFFATNIVKAMAGADAVVDASKEPIDMRDVYDYGTGTVKIIFLTRDVHGNVWSYLKRSRGKGNAALYAGNWVRWNRRIARFLEGVPRRDWMHVKYEELCADPIGTLKRLCDFLGYGYDPAMEQLNRVEPHTMFGNRIRHTKIEAIKEDLSWKQHLSPADIEVIDRIAGPTAKQIGY
jgi:hypothetical protein